MLNQRKYAEMLSLGTIHSPVNSQWVQWVSKAAMLVHWAWSAKKTQVIILSEWSTLGWDQWPIPLSRPTGLGDYTHTPLIAICGTVFPSANSVHQTLWTESNFQPSDYVPVQHTGPLGGNWTHNLRLTILDPDQLASGALSLKCSNGFITESMSIFLPNCCLEMFLLTYVKMSMKRTLFGVPSGSSKGVISKLSDNMPWIALCHWEC